MRPEFEGQVAVPDAASDTDHSGPNTGQSHFEFGKDFIQFGLGGEVFGLDKMDVTEGERRSHFVRLTLNVQEVQENAPPLPVRECGHLEVQLVQ